MLLIFPDNLYIFFLQHFEFVQKLHFSHLIPAGSDLQSIRTIVWKDNKIRQEHKD